MIRFFLGFCLYVLVMFSIAVAVGAGVLAALKAYFGNMTINIKRKDNEG